MKKFKMMLLITLLGMMVTGCVKFNATMDIKKDKSMNFSIIYALDKSVFGEETSLKEEDLENAKKEGFTITKYSEGNMVGFTLTKKINNIDDVSSEKDTEYNLSGMMNEEDNSYIFKVVKGNDKNTYYDKFKFDSNDSGLNNNQMENDDDTLVDESNDIDDLTENDDGNNPFEGMDLSKIMSSMDLSFSVTLPNPAISSNATTKEDNNKKLSWKLNTENAQTIEFAFDINNNSNDNNMILYIAIGAVALIVIIVLIIMMSKKNNGNKEVINNNDNNLKVENNDTITSIGNNDIAKTEPALDNDNK